MRPALELAAEAAAGAELAVVKAIPRSPDRLGVELRRPDGGMLAGQWFRHSGEALTAWDQTRRAAPTSGVRLVSGGLLLQPGGADRKLRGLHLMLATPGAVLVAHRPEKRAVLRQGAHRATTYVKVVRPSRLAATAAAARLTVPGVATPQVLAVDEALGTVTCAELPGRTLFDLLADPTLTDGWIEKVGYAVGGAVRRLHQAAVTTDLPSHDAAAELAVARRWAALAAEHHLLGDRADAVHRLLAEAEEELRVGTGPVVLLHRDLHDKQLLIDGLEVGMLDFDLAAFGDPALDLANLLTHLDLRARQQRCSTERAQRCAAAVRQGYGPVPEDWRRRLAGYELATRARLACVYAFRPAQAEVAAQLVRAPAR